MKVKRVKNIDGTSLVGYIDTTFKRLVEVFGRPCIEGKGLYDKISILWRLSINNKTVTIYDYKEPVMPVEGRYRWHIGGYSKGVDELVKDLVEGRQ